MAQIVAFESITLDGVMQGPGRPDEDTRGGFTHGGWAAPYSDTPEQGRAVAESMSTTGAMLLGRRTYEDFHQVWAGRTDNPFSAVFDNNTKYVASRTLREPLAWQNSVLLPDGADGVARLRREPGKDVVILGSGELVRSLAAVGLVDRWMLFVHPLVLGSGRRLFANDGQPAHLRLVSALPTSSGVIIATYAPA
jgi:dihydrofolate reductase